MGGPERISHYLPHLGENVPAEVYLQSWMLLVQVRLIITERQFVA